MLNGTDPPLKPEPPHLAGAMAERGRSMVPP